MSELYDDKRIESSELLRDEVSELLPVRASFGGMTFEIAYLTIDPPGIIFAACFSTDLDDENIINVRYVEPIPIVNPHDPPAEDEDVVAIGERFLYAPEGINALQIICEVGNRSGEIKFYERALGPMNDQWMVKSHQDLVDERNQSEIRPEDRLMALIAQNYQSPIEEEIVMDSKIFTDERLSELMSALGRITRQFEM